MEVLHNNYDRWLYRQLHTEFGDRLQPHFQRKSTLISLSHILEDQVLGSELSPVIFTAFQKLAYYRHEQPRYERLRAQSRLVTVFGVDLPGDLAFEQEWFVVINEPRFKALLASYELKQDAGRPGDESNRPFVGFWSYDPDVVDFATRLLAAETGSAAREATGQLLQEEFQAEDQFQAVSQVSSRILNHLEKTNLQIIEQVRQNQELIEELGRQTEQLQRLTGPERLAERQLLQQELVRLYNETSRSHTLMFQAAAQRTQLEQTIQTARSLLAQVQGQLDELIPAGQGAPVHDLLTRLHILLDASSEVNRP